MSIYKSYTPDQLDHLFSHFLINSWSYSKVTQFARHEKAFEMVYIYGESTKKSSTTIAGQAYHRALQSFFEAKKKGETLDIVELEKIVFEHVESIEPKYWKIQKTTPTVEECRQKAIKTSTALLNNFFSEIGTYLDEIVNIIDVELSCSEFLTINGVDIPLPCNAKIDLVVETKNDGVVIIDHKSKASFSDEEELKLSIGLQAITYVNSYEAKTGNIVSGVWFVENKYSKNKDNSQQLRAFKVSLDDDTRRLYEALLYEPLRSMLSAVNDPDHVYVINDSDNFVEKAQIYDFWAKTMIAEVEDFNIHPLKKDLIKNRLKKIRDASLATVNPKIIQRFRENAAEFIQYDLTNKNMTNEQKIEHILRSFGIITKVAYNFSGYSSNTYLLEVSAGVKISSVQGYRLDIASALNVSNVRIPSELTVHEGKSYLSIESSKKRDKDLIFDSSLVTGMKIPLGKDNYEKVVYWDLDNHATPHMLICGATGSGKSVSLQSTIEYAKLAGVDKIVILDPKYEFTNYNHSRIEVYNEIEEIEKAMKQLVAEMNQLVKDGAKQKTLIIFDEFADAVAQSRSGNELKVYEDVHSGNYSNGNPKFSRKQVGEEKSLEENLRILLQKGRSTGFRIIAATQRASTKIITGDAKVNFPVQVCFMVPKEMDSRVVLDEPGAESLAGKGDGLIKSPEYKSTVRFQAFYYSSDLIKTNNTIPTREELGELN